MPSKFEKITKKIEQIPSIKKEEEEILKFPPEEKAEQLWALWSEYRQKKYDTLLTERRKLRTERGKIEEVEKLPEITKLKEKIAGLWQKREVQSLFKKHLKENLEQGEKIGPDLKNYRQKEKKAEEVKKEYETLLRELFARREEEPDELTQIRIAELSVKIGSLRGGAERVFQENPELASFIQYETIKNYHRQFEKDGFIWTPSREKLFEDILNHLVLLNKNRPMLLVGETGTGKTRLVRAAIERLTGRPPFEVGEEAKSDIRPLLGSAWMGKEKTYIAYGPLGQALTGKKTSLDKKSDGGGVFYMDEMNGYPADALRSLIKGISGRAPGEEVTFAAWRGIREKIAEKSGLIGAANLPDEERGRHLDRAPLPIELSRELTALEVDYPEQTKENPELYEMMLASLMDKNGRIRLKEGELEPEFKEIVDAKTKEKTRELNFDPKSGGTLWRFSRLVSEIQRSYKGGENILTPAKTDASYLGAAVLDPGIVLSWLREYRVSRLRKGEELKVFLQEKLKKWSEQKIHSKEDQSLLKEFFAAFDLPIEGPDIKKSDVKSRKIWSEKEIGFLSPRVPRPKEKIEAPKPISKIAFLEDGTEIEYQSIERPEELIIEDKKISFIGKTSDGRVVLEDKGIGTAKLMEQKEFENIRKESHIERTRKGLNILKPEDLDRKLEQIIDYFVKSAPPKKQAEYRKELEKELKDFSKEKKINFILEQLK